MEEQLIQLNFVYAIELKRVIRTKTKMSMSGNVKKKCIHNWPLHTGAFQDQCKQTIMNKWECIDQIEISAPPEHGIVDVPRWAGNSQSVP